MIENALRSAMFVQCIVGIIRVLVLIVIIKNNRSLNGFRFSKSQNANLQFVIYLYNLVNTQCITFTWKIIAA